MTVVRVSDAPLLNNQTSVLPAFGRAIVDATGNIGRRNRNRCDPPLSVNNSSARPRKGVVGSRAAFPNSLPECDALVPSL